MIQFKNRITDVWDYPKQNIYTNDIDCDGHFYQYLSQNNNKKVGIRLYIHIPFCNSFCSFCQFYKEPCFKNMAENDTYFSAVLKELEMYASTKCLQNKTITSIFFGGGDPASIDGKYITMLLESIYKHYEVSPDVSITFEGNVKNLVTNNKVEELKKAGVSRISFGIQTLNEELRKKLLLKPTLNEINMLVDSLHKYFNNNFTFDLMYNLPDQSEEIIVNDIECSVQFEPEYIDYYNLNLYPNTIFFESIYKKKMFSIIPTKEREYELLRLIDKQLGLYGFYRVLSSTYSKQRTVPHLGLQNYLKSEEMIGIGPSARGFLSNRLYRNVCSVKRYIENISSGNFPVEIGTIMSAKDINYRRMILQIPLFTIKKDQIVKDYATKQKISELIDSGYLHENEFEYIVTEEGRYWIGNIQKYLYDEKWIEKEFNGFVNTIKDGRSAYNQDFMSVRGKTYGE